MLSRAHEAICWTFVPEESWHRPQQTPCLLLDPQWPGLHPLGPAWLGSKTRLCWWDGRALPVSQISERWRRWYRTNPGLDIFGWSSGKSASPAEFAFWAHNRFDPRQIKQCQIITVPLQACVTGLIVASFHQPSLWKNKDELTHNLHIPSRGAGHFCHLSQK